MRKKEAAAAIALFLFLIPFAAAFSGSGDGYDVFGVTGAGAASGSGDGYDIQFTPTNEPAGTGSGDGYNLVLGMFFAENITEPEEPPEEPPSRGGGGGGGCTDECEQGQTICSVESELFYMACEYSAQYGCWKWFPYQCESSYVCEEGACVPGACVEDWICDEWSECEHGIQTRYCKDWAGCNTYEKKPSEQKECEQVEEGEAEEKGGLSWVKLAPPEPEVERPSIISGANILTFAWIAVGALMFIAIAIGIRHGIPAKPKAPPVHPDVGMYYIKGKHLKDINTDLKRINKSLEMLKKK